MAKKPIFRLFSIFSKTVHTIRTKFSTVILHYIRVLYVQRHQKKYGWDVRNIAKISPKMAIKQPFFDFFDFLKNCPYDSNENFYSYSTPYESPICAMASKSYGWDVRNIAKISPKMAKKTVIFRFFFDFLKNCPYDSNENFYSYSTPY